MASLVGMKLRTQPWPDFWRGVLVAAFPLVLLLPLGADVSGDWLSHLWTITHCGEFWRAHGLPPEAFHADEAVGIPWTVFYGPIFYNVLGIAAVWLDARIVTKALLLVLFATQFFLIRRGFRAHGIGAPWAGTVAAVWTWATYPLTNLYNRGAVGEVFGTGLLACAVACLLVALGPAASLAGRRRHMVGFWLCAALVLGTHPISVLFAALILPFLIALGIALRRGGELRLVGWRPIATGAALCAVVSSGWLFAALTEASELGIASGDRAPVPRSQHLDWWVTRFFPVPFDVRMHTTADPRSVSTPHMDTQVSMPLLVGAGLLLVAAGRAGGQGRGVGREPVAWVVAVGVGGLLWLSLATPGFSLLPRPFWSIQFVYRTVTVVNLALLLAVWALLVRLGETGAVDFSSSRSRRWLAVLVIWAAVAVAIKLAHAWEARPEGRGGAGLREAAARDYAYQLHGFLYGFAEMTNVRLLARLEVPGDVPLRLRFAPHPGLAPRAADAQWVELPVRQWVLTNVQAFRWNRLLLDGRPVRAEELRLGDVSRNQLALEVPAGRHEIAYRYEAPWVWRWLHRIGLVVLVLWIAGFAWWVGRRRPEGA